MNRKVEKLKKLRLFLLNEISSFDNQQLNFIPPAFNNNIIWNLGHIIAAQQNMCYVRAGLPVVVGAEFLKTYQSGTKPVRDATEEEIQTVKKMTITTLDRLDSDLNRNVFTNYTPSPGIQKVYGFDVLTSDEALDYLLYHDGVHTGTILALTKVWK